jgi:FMN phosphatase YigB (HAD superfamily)
VRSAKPSPGIYRHALSQLGVAAEAAVFVDDQARFCAGSVAVGVRAAQIVRGELDGQRPAEGITLVRSLSEVEAMFGE